MPKCRRLDECHIQKSTVPTALPDTATPFGGERRNVFGFPRPRALIQKIPTRAFSDVFCVVLSLLYSAGVVSLRPAAGAPPPCQYKVLPMVRR